MGSTKLPFSHKPLMLYNGRLTCQTQSGKTSSILLSTHSFLNTLVTQKSSNNEQLQSQLQEAIKLKRYHPLQHTLLFIYIYLVGMLHSVLISFMCVQVLRGMGFVLCSGQDRSLGRAGQSLSPSHGGGVGHQGVSQHGECGHGAVTGGHKGVNRGHESFTESDKEMSS